ncbi:MAG: hypothetical protein IT204_02215 [Fimbriimonadaceae bacterium]|nr:hypothetical protein [Fimbriimonadaceae bacterium]
MAQRSRRDGWRWLLLLGLLSRVALADLVGDLASASYAGRHDQVIALASARLPTAGADAAVLRYLRGVASYRTGWVAAAAVDLAQASDQPPWPGWPDPADLRRRAARLAQLAPPQASAISTADTVCFRVYQEPDHPWGTAVRAALPEAHYRVTAYFGVELPDTAVFIFRDAARYTQFFEAWSGYQPIGWQWGTGTGGVLLFVECNPAGRRIADPTGSYFRAVIAHEFGHCALHRQTGTAPLPPWLDEGLAMLCGELVCPAEGERYRQGLADLAAHRRELPLTTLLEHRLFYDPATARDAYNQAYALTELLLRGTTPADRQRLLAALSTHRDLDTALRTVGWPDQVTLYNRWLRELRPGEGN